MAASGRGESNLLRRQLAASSGRAVVVMRWSGHEGSSSVGRRECGDEFRGGARESCGRARERRWEEEDRDFYWKDPKVFEKFAKKS